MHPNRLELADGLWADPRGALWIEPARTLAIADIHLGYAWVQRQRGALLPLVEFERTEARLAALQAGYCPQVMVFLGDLVHADLLVQPVADMLRRLLDALAGSSRLVLTLGNHDRRLEEFVHRTAAPLSCVRAWRSGPHLLRHGDEKGLPDRPGLAGQANGSLVDSSHPLEKSRAMRSAVREKRRQGSIRRTGRPQEDVSPETGGMLITGHEHPAVELGDGVATRVRCPCFLLGRGRLMLPAFSGWAAGAVIGREPFMSEAARQAQWLAAIAIVGDRLLRLPLPVTRG